MASIFHYTDSTGLLGILASRSLFATDYRYLNDATEGSLIQDLIVPVLESEIADIIPKLVSKGFIKGFYEFHGVSGNRSQAEGFFRSLIKVVNNVSPLFILSFCRHDPGTKQFDHGLLSQWRAYGGTGGFAMEFDEDGLDEALKTETKKFAYGPIKSDDVRYSDYGKLFDAKMYQGVAGEMIRKMFEPRDVSAITGRKNFDEVVVDFVKAAPFMKHEGFSEEREYRICAVCIRPSHIPKGSKERPKRIKFRSRSGMIVPYIDLLSRFNFNLPLKSIIVGPHPFQERQMDSIKLALEDAKFPGVTVRMSAIPFRI